MREFVRLSRGEQLRVLCAALLITALPAALRLGSFSTVRAVLVRTANRCQAAVSGTPPVDRVVHAVEATDAAVPGDRTCLVRSLTSEALLRLYGYTPTHRIGVDPQSDEFAAHSWLEYDGAVLIGELADMTQYKPLPPLDRFEDQ